MAWSQTRDRLANLNHEITIAGGGLAGLALATALRLQQVPVTVLEAGNYPRHRVCGEFISGVSENTLAVLGITDSFAGALRHRSLTWYQNGQQIYRDQLPNPAFGISRYRLDERLREHLEALGGTVITGMRAQPTANEGFVWTAGRRPVKGQWIGLKAHIRHLPTSAGLEMHTGNNGYAGLVAVEDGWTNVCGLFQINRSLLASGSDLLPAYLEAGGNRQLAAMLRDSEWRAGSFSAVAGFQLGRQASLPGLLVLGDAESMIPPFTGNGMSMAFEAAECALAPLVAWSRGEQAWQHCVNCARTAVTRKFKRRLAAAKLLHAVLLNSNGRSLLHSLAAARLLPFQPILQLVR